MFHSSTSPLFLSNTHQDVNCEVIHLERFIAGESAAQANIVPSQSRRVTFGSTSSSGVRETVSVDMAIDEPVTRKLTVNSELDSKLMHDSISDYHDPMMGVHQANVV